MSRIRLALVPFAFAGLLIATGMRPAAQTSQSADIEQGKKLFQGMCARCHGLDGTGEEGPNLNRPTLARAADGLCGAGVV